MLGGNNPPSVCKLRVINFYPFFHAITEYIVNKKIIQHCCVFRFHMLVIGERTSWTWGLSFMNQMKIPFPTSYICSWSHFRYQIPSLLASLLFSFFPFQGISGSTLWSRSRFRSLPWATYAVLWSGLLLSLLHCSSTARQYGAVSTCTWKPWPVL